MPSSGRHFNESKGHIVSHVLVIFVLVFSRDAAGLALRSSNSIGRHSRGCVLFVLGNLCPGRFTEIPTEIWTGRQDREGGRRRQIYSVPASTEPDVDTDRNVDIL